MNEREWSRRILYKGMEEKVKVIPIGTVYNILSDWHMKNKQLVNIKPKDGMIYQYEECCRHPRNCICDGCNIYFNGQPREWEKRVYEVSV